MGRNMDPQADLFQHGCDRYIPLIYAIRNLLLLIASVVQSQVDVDSERHKERSGQIDHILPRQPHSQ